MPRKGAHELIRPNEWGAKAYLFRLAGIQPFSAPAVAPALATASLVPAFTSTQLCWLILDALKKVNFTDA